ncbi:hypothetical protein PoB_007384600 [Plakobranchus ocellatus]|uniref:Uncharacterized protein n=1 Tax=Plakobranchus ocellatus TaxID=259542 RepID=A0AAV4DU20_9GAST|nr:hypothetical protein PoB_007384600 [Plakobranchus ocellatus]
MAGQLREAYRDKGLCAPEAMITLVEEEKEVGAAGRHSVYARLYGAWCASTVGAGNREGWRGGGTVWPV